LSKGHQEKRKTDNTVLQRSEILSLRSFNLLVRSTCK